MLSLVDTDAGKAMHALNLKIAMRTRRVVLSTAIVIVLVASTGCYRQEGSSAVEADPGLVTEQSSKAPNDRPSAGLPAADVPVAEQSAVLAYLCERGPVCDSDILGAKDPEEARWLLQNGYPSSEQLKRFNAMSDDQLKREADSGSLAAMVIYGERLVSEGDTDAGLVYVFDATQRGSIYGYYAMSSAYQNTPGLTSIVESGAYLRVAYILGDSKASQELQRRFPGLQQMEQAAIDRRASSLYQTFAQTRQPIPRP